MKARRILPFAAAVAALAVGDAALAQVRRQRAATVIFSPTGNYQNPGARAFGLGGAFVGLADDASAAELNPAGLSQLRRPELSVEFRRLETTIPVRYPGASSAGQFECVGFSGSGPPCQQDGRSSENSLSFVSLVVPGSSNLTFAAYRHELDRERFSIVRPAYTLEDRQVPGTLQQLDRRLDRTGLAIAWAPAQSLSVGVTAHVNTLNQTFSLSEYSTPSITDGPLGGAPSVLWSLLDQHVDQSKVGGTAGVLWRPIRPLAVGLSYSLRVRYMEAGVRQPCASYRNDGTAVCGFSHGVPDPSNAYTRVETTPPFTLPARAAGGISFRPAGWLTLVAETDFVTYSDNNVEIPRVVKAVGPVPSSITFDRLVSSDVWEIHAGAEGAFPFAGSGLAAVRVGYWRDPDHSFRYDRCRDETGATCTADAFFSRTNPPRGDFDHLTGGVGIAWKWGQVDFGYDWIRQEKRGSYAVSVVLRTK